MLLDTKDINNSISRLGDFISKLCAYGTEINKLTEPQRIFYFNQKLEMEVNNGGFNQFFFNSTGDFASEIVQSLRTIGAHRTAEILQQAINEFPDKVIPKDRNKRIELMRQIEKNAIDVWEELDQRFFLYEEDLNSLNLEYIKQNKNSF